MPVLFLYLEVDIQFLEKARRHVVHPTVDSRHRIFRLLLLDHRIREQVDARFLHVQLYEAPMPLFHVFDGLKDVQTVSRRSLVERLKHSPVD